MAIYFPPALLGMDSTYPAFVNTDVTALSGWYTFLRGLYTAISSVGTSTGECLSVCVCFNGVLEAEP